MKVNKDYIIEGNFIKSGSDISILEDVSLLGTFDANGNGVTKDSFDDMCKPIIDTLTIKKILAPNTDSYDKNVEKIKSFMLTQFNRMQKLPTDDEVIQFAKTLPDSKITTNY